MRLSKDKKDRITEQILQYLFHAFPKQPFTAEIARDIARDEEFVKALMIELKEKGLVIEINKNNKGEILKRRLKWRLSSKVYDIYKSQATSNIN